MSTAEADRHAIAHERYGRVGRAEGVGDAMQIDTSDSVEPT